jgi:hypothetical protein
MPPRLWRECTLEGNGSDVFSLVGGAWRQADQRIWQQNTIKVWNMDTWACERTFEGHNHAVRTIPGAVFDAEAYVQPAAFSRWPAGARCKYWPSGRIAFAQPVARPAVWWEVAQVGPRWWPTHPPYSRLLAFWVWALVVHGDKLISGP